MPGQNVILEGVREQFSFEVKPWKMNVQGKMAAPTVGAIESAIDSTDGTDVKATIVPGAVTIVETFKVKFTVQSLQAGRTYTIAVSFGDGTNTLGGEMTIYCPK